MIENDNTHSTNEVRKKCKGIINSKDNIPFVLIGASLLPKVKCNPAVHTFFNLTEFPGLPVNSGKFQCWTANGAISKLLFEQSLLYCQKLQYKSHPATITQKPKLYPLIELNKPFT